MNTNSVGSRWRKESQTSNGSGMKPMNFFETSNTPQGLGVRQAPGALESGRGLPQSKTLARGLQP